MFQLLPLYSDPLCGSLSHRAWVILLGKPGRLLPGIVAVCLLIGGSGRAAVVSAVFNSASDIPITANGYTIGSDTLQMTLNFAPDPGTPLTVIRNTGLSFISGKFSNLPQGGALSIKYNSSQYNYIANYYGGKGNDLVLLWQGTQVVTWGNDNAGQLGNSQTTALKVPTRVYPITELNGKTPTKLATTSTSTLMLCSDGSLFSWGSNRSGEMGTGSNTSSNVPVAVYPSGALAGKVVTAIAGGSNHYLALCSDGTLVAWGGNNQGQLGNNSTTSSNQPVLVTRLGTPLEGKTITAIAAGGLFSAALCSDGTLATWGSNSSGQLGNNSTALSLIPTAVVTSGTPLQTRVVTAISIGSSNCLALCSDGTVTSWGGNSLGSLGDGTNTQSLIPIAVLTTGTALAGKTVKAISAGRSSNCLALCTDGTMVAWGDNAGGELGNNSTSFYSKTAVAVTMSGVLATKTVASISAGAGFDQALCMDGTVVLWGSNSFGQLGNNSLTKSRVPVAVTISPVLVGKAIIVATTGGSHCAAFCSDGTPVTWGDNSSGQLGTSGPTTFPTPVLGSPGGSVYVSAATGALHSMLLASTGFVVTCGYNGNGQLGNGNNTSTSYFVPIKSSGAMAGKKVVAIAAGDSHNLVLCSDGSLYSWGANASGQLGNNSLVDSNEPVAVDTSGVLVGKSVAAIACGEAFSAALCTDGTVATWGQGLMGQLGNNSTSDRKSPVLAQTGALFITRIACGTDYCLALANDGTVLAWGNDGNGQLGNALNSSSSIPVLVSTNNTALTAKTVSSLFCGSFRGGAVCADGSLTTWGAAYLGNGAKTDSNVPILINSGALSGRSVLGAAAGNSRCFAWCSDGTLSHWGPDISITSPTLVDTSTFSPGDKITACFTSTTASHFMALVASPPPTVLLPTITQITSTAATLNGSTLSPDYNGTAVFEYDSVPDRFSIVLSDVQSVTANTSTEVSSNLSGLNPGTTYYVRLHTTNRTGSTYSNVISFTTLSNDATVSLLTESSNSLSPAFSPQTFSYRVSVPYWYTTLAMTPVTNNDKATFVVWSGSSPATSSLPGGSTADLPLNATGETSFQIWVTSEDGSSKKHYDVTVNSKSTFDLWRQKYFKPNASKTALTDDADGDGVLNLRDFAFGTDPTRAASNLTSLNYSGNTITPGAITSEQIAGVPVAEFIRRTDYLSLGLQYTVQFSNRLDVWETSAIPPRKISSDGTLDVVGVNYPILSDHRPARFFRVVVSKP